MKLTLGDAISPKKIMPTGTNQSKEQVWIIAATTEIEWRIHIDINI